MKDKLISIGKIVGVSAATYVVSKYAIFGVIMNELYHHDMV